jgi:hypothetical protein
MASKTADALSFLAEEGTRMSIAEKYAADKLYGTHISFKTKWRHRKLRFFTHFNQSRPLGLRAQPELVVLEPKEGLTPSEKPPVRIYMGTEPHQHRAERILIWSITQVRDPARRYEIYLMKDLAGFDRRGWKTGFTFYRYAIPAMAGYEGRAIFNDVDQIYFADPAELFDMDMGDAGVMCINERETSVMLIDCAKMADAWRLEQAQTGRMGGHKHTFFRGQMHEKGLWGPLPGVWNARDWEYKEGKSKLLHYTTVHSQPWRPFPKELRYRTSPEGEAWLAMERSADVAGFTYFTQERPTQHYGEVLDGWAARRAALSTSASAAMIAKLVREKGAETLLDFGAVGLKAQQLPGAVDVISQDLQTEEPVVAERNSYDGVVCLGLLSEFATEDIPWMLDKLFRQARSFVFVAAAADATKARGVMAASQDAYWWQEQMKAAARRVPGIDWTLSLSSDLTLSPDGQVYRP